MPRRFTDTDTRSRRGWDHPWPKRLLPEHTSRAVEDTTESLTWLLSVA